MIKVIQYILLFIIVFNGFAQTKKSISKNLLKSAMTTVGSFTATSLGKNYKIIQSIGQSSITGTKKSTSLVVQQGFLYNVVHFNIDNSEKEVGMEKLSFTISPNPFVDLVKIDFSRKTLFGVQIQIFDMTGRFIFSEEYQPTNSIIIPMRNFAVATYIVLITSGKNSYSKKVIKEY